MSNWHVVTALFDFSLRLRHLIDEDILCVYTFGPVIAQFFPASLFLYFLDLIIIA